VLCEPLAGSDPLQAPAALHEAAFVEVHASVADWPASIVVSDAVSETVGTGVGMFVTPPQAVRSIAGPRIRREYNKRTASPRLVFASLRDRLTPWRAVIRSTNFT
jgi:hypothetical protein